MLIITDGLPRGAGYLEIDQRAAGIPVGTTNTPHFEADTYTCKHCQSVVVLNPLRKRERYKCYNCNHHVCDPCAAKLASGEKCVPWEQFLSDLLTQDQRQSSGTNLILP